MYDILTLYVKVPMSGGIIMQLPVAFEDKMKALLGAEFESYLSCYEEPRYYGLRVNTNKISVEDFLRLCPFKLQPIPWIKNGFYYDGEHVSPAKHPYYFAGLYYLQEPSAMTPADRLPIMEGERVLDLCAAPGGKATELGARLQSKGVLVANDISSSRAKGLLKNLELFGIGNVILLTEEPEKLSTYFPEYFDKILIDAPCSGEGMFRKDKKMIKSWEQCGPDFFSKIQKNIIYHAANMLKPGGMLLYSTCTFDPAENEQIIDYLIQEREDISICDMAPYEGFSEGLSNWEGADYADLKKTVRIFPHKMHGEGHYLALLKKESADSPKESCSAFLSVRKELSDAVLAFLEQTTLQWDVHRCHVQEERVYYMPEQVPVLKGIRCLRTGLLLGVQKKNRFEPSQALAMYLTKEDFPYILDLPASDGRVVKYLKGETLDVEDQTGIQAKGWYLCCVDGFPLGWGKLSDGMLKNKYTPGWRWQS